MALIAVRGLVAQQERPQMTWPKSFQNCRTANSVKKEMLSSWLGTMTASISRTLSPPCLALDIITPLLSILTPPTIRPVRPIILYFSILKNQSSFPPEFRCLLDGISCVFMTRKYANVSCQVAAQLLTAKEKDEVAQLVNTMLGFGISYKHPKPGQFKLDYGMEGLSALSLSPPIDTLVKFKVTPFLYTLCITLLSKSLSFSLLLDQLPSMSICRLPGILYFPLLIIEVFWSLI